VADIQTQLAEALRDRYVLERELGRGGMATVFLAQDLKHDRPVAVKVLRPELAATVGPARFRREIHLAARLQHPHILTVLDSGETAGQLWYTMPYVEGETLRDRLQREGQLPVEEALRIAREAAQALQYAHEHGVVHRDIKPANLLLTRDGNTLVADFGIARVLGGGDERLTETGLSIGTPAYMSPEQAAGEPMLDVRTDLYSLASVLYEMVAGEPPFTGPTAQAIITKRLSVPAPSVRRLRPAVGPGLDQAIQRALAPVPRDRFATMAEFAHALQRATASTATATVPAKATRSLLQRPQASLWAATAAALAIALAAAIGLTRRHEWSVAARAMGSQRLAVLPFENLGDTAELYFTDGITDEVRGKLAAVPGLEVIARSSSNQYKSSSKPAQEIARELGVQYLLTATVRWEKSPGRQSRVRVSPELVRITSGSAPTTMWEQSFDAVLSDVF